MKGNNGLGNVIERDDWQTPQWLFDILDKQYSFETDCCASKENAKCKIWYNDFLNKLVNRELVCWMNPPFSKAEEMFRRFFEKVNFGICIYRCDNMETKLWQEIILKKADWIFIPKGRISYEGKEGTGSRFPSALIGVGIKPPKELDGHTLICSPSTVKENKDE